MAGESGPAVAAPATGLTQAHAETGEQAGGEHEGGMLQPWYTRGPIPPVASGSEGTPSKPTASEQAYGEDPQSIDVTPERHRFEPVEVGAVSDPLTVAFSNHRTDAIELDRVELRSKDFDLITPFQPGLLSAGAQLALEVALRPTQVGNIQGHLTLFGHTREGSKVSRGLTLLGTGGKPKAENADRRELSVAKRNARDLERARDAPATTTYAEMLAAVLAAQDLTKHEDDDDRRHAELLLKSVQKRMDELEPVSFEKLRGMGFGNTTGHLIFDGAKSAIDTWIRKLALGASIATDPLVTEFRVGAEAIRLCTGERKDAPNLEKVGEVGKQTAEIGIAAIAALPAVGVLIEEAGLVVFTTRLAGQRVLTWALLNPAQALAASEALLGFGVQIGQDGWDTFWDQLHDPRGFMYIAMQIAMDVMHVQSSGGGRTSPQAPHEPSTEEIGEIKTRLTGVRQTLEQVEQQVAGGSTKNAGSTTARHDDEPHAVVGRRNKQPTETSPEQTHPSNEAQRVAAKQPMVAGGRLWVAEDQLKIHERITSKEWTFAIEVPLMNGRSTIIVDGAVELDESGRPIGGPQFVIDNRVTLDGEQLRVAIGDGRSERASVTDVALDRAVLAFKGRFGHEPEELSGHLAMNNKRNFQIEYLKAVDHGVPPDQALIEAVKAISFGRARVQRGYSDISVEAHGEDVIMYGEPPQQRRVPDNIDVKAKRR